MKHSAKHNLRAEMECFENFDVRIMFDSLSRIGENSVMPILYEEQVLTWTLLRRKILEVIKSHNGTIDFLDVGTGSGFWPILLRKELIKLGKQANIVAIERNRRAIRVCTENMKENGVHFGLKFQKYSLASAPHQQVKSIFMNPPYHIYPSSVSSNVRSHAKGGFLGYEEFINWLSIANYHLTDDGSIFFHHMCLGDSDPEFLRFIPVFIEGNPSIEYYELLPPIDTSVFLKGVYKNDFADFIYDTFKRFPKIHFATGIVTRNGLGRLRKKTIPLNMLHGKSWEDRILLHRTIAGIK